MILFNFKKNSTTKHRLLSTILLTLFFAATTTYANEVPNLIHFEGYLTKNGAQKNNKGNLGKFSNGGGGQAVQDGEYDMVFSLYDVPADGDPLWTETWDNSTSQVLVSKGHYRVFLGTYTPLTPAFFKENPATYLGITIGDDEELLPRQKIASVPYAMSTYSDEPPFPAGGIIMWSGEIGDIPEGWALCDGTNNTPDLRDRFILGAGGNYGPGQAGGDATINLNHSHNVALNSNNAGAHDHTFSGETGEEDRDEKLDDTGDEGHVANDEHTHDYSGTTSRIGDHNHSISGSIDNALATIEHRPPFFALAYIMKLKPQD